MGVSADRLACLTTYADERGRLAWWQLHRAVPAWVLTAVHAGLGAVVCGLLGVVTLGLYGRWWFGLVFGLVLGAGGSLLLARLQGDRRPRRLWAPGRRRADQAGVFAAVATLVGGVVVGPVYGWGVAAIVATVLAGVFAAAAWPAAPVELDDDGLTPMSVLRADRAVVAALARLGLIAGAAVGGILGALHINSPAGLAVDVSDPVALVGLGAGWGALVAGAGLGLLGEATSVWGRFVTARVYLAARGLTPLRLMTALEKGCERDQLRRDGAFYQLVL